MKIHFYGCSYSDGGGMDLKKYHDLVKHEEWAQEFGEITYYENHPYNYEFKDFFRFSDIIKRKLNCEIENKACTGNNNQNIFDTLMDELENDNNDIHIVQWSHFHRNKLWYEPTKKFYRLSGFEKNAIGFEEDTDIGLEGDLTDFHNQWIKNHFNQDYEVKKVVNFTKVLSSYSDNKNIPIYFITWDELPYINDKFIRFHEKKELNWMQQYSNHEFKLYGEEKKYTIKWSTNNIIDDNHLSYEGNLMVANKIINRLKKDELL